MMESRFLMNVLISVVFVILVALGFVSPVILIWGWVRWAGQPKLRTVPSILSLTAFVFATASATLAVSSIIYAGFHGFPYFDPLLLKVFRGGGILSLAGIFFGVGGVWQKSSLRWYAPVCALGTLAFWMFAAAGE